MAPYITKTDLLIGADSASFFSFLLFQTNVNKGCEVTSICSLNLVLSDKLK